MAFTPPAIALYELDELFHKIDKLSDRDLTLLIEEVDRRFMPKCHRAVGEPDAWRKYDFMYKAVQLYIDTCRK